ncbi:hypothetical protein BT63DRAFT_453231 [Microthyrium microscopicum]|uniref:Uncharacterized protein n=1 Tax=Microthyrium microscopicum TaxID=703497 RepID=A0A6A6UFA0_9PEZI|nr:hypothetical protein BT63DRAFT_453231 [Microthyrium microscopicum]
MAPSQYHNAIEERRLVKNLNRMPPEIVIQIIRHCFPLAPASVDSYGYIQHHASEQEYEIWRPGVSKYEEAPWADLFELYKFEKCIAAAFQMTLAIPSLSAAFLMDNKFLATSFASYRQSAIELGTYGYIALVAAVASSKPDLELNFLEVKTCQFPLTILLAATSDSIRHTHFTHLYREAYNIAFAVLELAETAPELCTQLGENFLPAPKEFPCSVDHVSVVINRVMRVVQHLQLYLAFRHWLRGRMADVRIEALVFDMLRYTDMFGSYKDPLHTFALLKFFHDIVAKEKAQNIRELMAEGSEVPEYNPYAHTIASSALISSLFLTPEPVLLPDAEGVFRKEYHTVADRLRIDPASYVHRLGGPKDDSYQTEVSNRFLETGESFCDRYNLSIRWHYDKPPTRREPCIHEYYLSTNTTARLVLDSGQMEFRKPRPGRLRPSTRDLTRRQTVFKQLSNWKEWRYIYQPGDFPWHASAWADQGTSVSALNQPLFSRDQPSMSLSRMQDARAKHSKLGQRKLSDLAWGKDLVYDPKSYAPWQNFHFYYGHGYHSMCDSSQREALHFLEN